MDNWNTDSYCKTRGFNLVVLKYNGVKEKLVDLKTQVILHTLKKDLFLILWKIILIIRSSGNADPTVLNGNIWLEMRSVSFVYLRCVIGHGSHSFLFGFAHLCHTLGSEDVRVCSSWMTWSPKYLHPLTPHPQDLTDLPQAWLLPCSISPWWEPGTILCLVH